MDLQKLQKMEAKSLYDSNGLKIVDINGTKAIEEKDKIIILPYYVQKRGILLRYENVPAFEVKQKGISHYLTALTTTINNDDQIGSVKDALEKNYGIRIYLDDKINITNPIFLTTTQTTKYYFAFVHLYDGQYEEVQVTDYQQLEFKDKNAYISVDELDNAIIYDLITNYSINHFKEKYLLF